jgi:predicted amidohydrolase YtcJ
MKLILLSILLSFSSCKKVNNANEASQSNEQFYKNGQIYTVNASQEWAEAMLVRNGIIIAIGTEAGVRNQASGNAQIIDLNNKMVMPGIHDVHLHPLEAASNNFQFILNETETDPENYAADIQKALNNKPNAAWTLGWGFDIYTLFDATREPIEILDDISTTQPIAVMELTSHSIWVNSKAL